MKSSLKVHKLKIELLRNKSHRFNVNNILKLKTKNELIIALNKKYKIFFDIVNSSHIQYKQFLSGFFKCIIHGLKEPFSIKILIDNKIIPKVYNNYTSNYNYITLLPWSKFNLINGTTSKKNIYHIKINKEQFMQALIVLFPKFIKTYPKILLDLNNKLNDTPKPTISMIHLYKYLIYCGDKLAKNLYEKKNKGKFKFKISKNKVINFLKIFTVEQLKQILLN